MALCKLVTFVLKVIPSYYENTAMSICFLFLIIQKTSVHKKIYPTFFCKADLFITL